MERRTIARFGRMAYATAVYQLNRGRIESIDATRALLWPAIQETFDPDTRSKSLELFRSDGRRGRWRRDPGDWQRQTLARNGPDVDGPGGDALQ